MRILVAALPLAALAAVPLLAAKPPAGGPLDTEREAYRGRAVSACVAELRAVPDLSPDDLEGICGCALDRFLSGRGTEALPPLGASRLRGPMEGDLLGCAAELRPDRAAAIARRGIVPPPLAAAPPAAPKPPPDEDAAAVDEAEPDFDLWAWLRDLAVPAWAWIAISFLLILLAAALLRRRDDRRHLLGPPPSMRHRTGPVAPRRPDLPPPR
jgi:hypothetical protein